jgi:hypothetical protein
MTVVAQTLISAQQAPAAQTTLYPSPASTRTIIDKFTGTNTTAATAKLTVNLVKSGGAASAANVISSAVSIAPGQAYTFPELIGHVLDAGDFISVLADTAAAITVRASGRQVTT